jgi:hypothetical protein
MYEYYLRCLSRTHLETRKDRQGSSDSKEQGSMQGVGLRYEYGLAAGPHHYVTHPRTPLHSQDLQSRGAPGPGARAQCALQGVVQSREEGAEYIQHSSIDERNAHRASSRRCDAAVRRGAQH